MSVEEVFSLGQPGNLMQFDENNRFSLFEDEVSLKKFLDAHFSIRSFRTGNSILHPRNQGFETRFEVQMKSGAQEYRYQGVFVYDLQTLIHENYGDDPKSVVNVCRAIERDFPEFDGRMMFADRHLTASRFTFGLSDKELLNRIFLEESSLDTELMSRFGL